MHAISDLDDNKDHNSKRDQTNSFERTKVENVASQKRIDYIFSLLNELRTGNVTYSDIVRRERFHPPVRKILMKLGVQKVSDITDEELLYSTIVDVIVKKTSTNDEGNKLPTDFEQENIEEIDDKDSNISESSPAKLQTPKKEASLAPSPILSTSSPSKSAFAKDDDYSQMRKLVLAVHAQNGRVKAALASFYPPPNVSLERLIAVVNGVCSFAGTQRLFKSVPESDVLSSFDNYWNRKLSKQSENKNKVSGGNRNNKTVNNDPTPEVIVPPLQLLNPSDLPNSNAKSDSEVIEPLSLETVDDFVDYGDNSPAASSPSPFRDLRKTLQPDYIRYVDSPEKPASLSEGQYTRVTLQSFGDDRDPRFIDNRTGRIRLDSGESVSSNQNSPYSMRHLTQSVNIPFESGRSVLDDDMDITFSPNENTDDFRDFYVSFWEKVFALFFFVSNPFESVERCLEKVEDIIVLVDSVPEYHSPVIVVALDVIVQRAMYELSDKVVKDRRPSHSDGQATIAVKNIDRCVSLMSTLVIPLCEKLLMRFNLTEIPGVAVARFTEKVQTLSRQLQELTAWTSFQGQQKVRQTFPVNIHNNNTNASGNNSTNLSPRGVNPTTTSNSANRGVVLDAVDDNLKLFLKEAMPPGYLMSDVEKMRVKLHKLLSRQVSGEMTISLCGSAALGLADSELKMEADFVALISPYNLNFYNLKHQYCVMETEKLQMLQEEFKEIEKSVEKELLAEYAHRHVKASSKDVRNITAELLSNIKNVIINEMRRTSTQGLSSLLRAFANDLDAIINASDEVLKKYSAIKQEKLRDSQGLSMIMKKMEVIQDMLDRSENDKNQLTRKMIKTVEKSLKDIGCVNIRPITTKARFLHVKFTSHEVAKEPLHVNLIFNTVTPIQTTELLSAYACLDRTNKIHDFLLTIKVFTKAHRICDPALGFLSSCAWFVMAIHVLLRYEFLPNIHSHILYRGDESSTSSGIKAVDEYEQEKASSEEGGIFRDFVINPMHLPQKYAAKIESTSLLEMLDIFFRYYVEVFDPFESVATLKHSGEVLKKSVWRKNATLWRLSIEDPFDHVNSIHPYDLGSTLSRPGQLTTFKALRRAIYGIHSIVISGMDSCRQNIKKFFSRNDLIHLARRAEYLGTIMNLPKQWTKQNKSDVSHIESNQLIDRKLNLELIYAREYLPRRLISSCINSEYFYDGIICASDLLDTAPTDGSVHTTTAGNEQYESKPTDKSTADVAFRAPSSIHTELTPRSQFNTSLQPSQTMQQQLQQQNPHQHQPPPPQQQQTQMPKPVISVPPTAAAVQAKSELEYHRKVNHSQPFRSQYHYQPPHPSQLQQQQQQGQQSTQQTSPSTPAPPTQPQQQSYHQQQGYHQQPPPRQSFYPPEQQYQSMPRRAFVPPQQQYQPPPHHQQQQQQSATYSLPRFDLARGAQTDSLRNNKSFPAMDRDSSYPRKEFIPASAYSPAAAANRPNDLPTKVVKDPRFKFVSQAPATTAHAEDAVGYVYDRMRPTRGVGADWDRNAGVRQQSSYGNDNSRFEPELPLSGRSHPLSVGGKYDVFPPSNMAPVDNRSFEDSRGGGYDHPFFDRDDMAGGGHMGGKGPIRPEEVVMSARRGGLYSSDTESRNPRNTGGDEFSSRKPPLYESAVKARPFVPAIPLSGLLTSRSNNGLIFDVDDSDIHTTGRSNFSADNEYSARIDPLNFEMAVSKAPKKSPVPPISLAGLTSRSGVPQYDYDEPLKSDRFLDLSCVPSSAGSDFFSQSSNDKSNTGSDTNHSNRFLNLLNEKAEPFETEFSKMLDDHGSEKSNNRSVLWGGRPTYAEECASEGSHLTPRQSHTTHDSSHYNATPRTTTTPRIPSAAAAPFIPSTNNIQSSGRNLNYPSPRLANDFAPDDGTSAIFSGYKAINPMPGMPLPAGYSSNEDLTFDLFGNNNDQYHLASSNFDNDQSETKSNEKQL